jgi:sugar lactone lactonase YvrE
VWRIVPGHTPEVFVDDLTTVVDRAFGPDGSLYASQRVTDVTSEDFGGAVVRVRPNGQRTVLGEGSLFLPGGVAVSRRGHVYVATGASCLRPAAPTPLPWHAARSCG